MQVSAPAKVNLSLKIEGRRADGFHDIETFIAPIALADQLTLEKAGAGEGIVFHCDDPSIPQGPENLVVRAARAFFDKTKEPADVRIELRKKIPHGAGLGGGSSDAASVLIGLNELFQANLSREALLEMGGVIGSDVPFFIFGSAALCRGRGELVAYARWQKSREIPGISYASQEFRGYRFFNDLERPVFEKFVFLAEMKMWLLRQPEVGAALMSGSGSTMFAVLRDGTDANGLAERAQAELDPKLWCFACETGHHLPR
jgi:4-diphosphocytidyl-2-C-methyl-D-erythritol kinase